MPVIVTENLSKQYRLGVISTKTLREDIERWSARLFRKPDPALNIDSQGSDSGKRIWVLQDINLQIDQGEAVGIIGRMERARALCSKSFAGLRLPQKAWLKLGGVSLVCWKLAPAFIRNLQDEKISS